jgi:phage terminase large subunit-like protein
MSELIIPLPEAEPWPTLGPGVCGFIEEYVIHGPGDLRGAPVTLSQEQRALIYRLYEVYPEGHEQAGRRRFKRAAISLRKGSGKTEFAAWIAACELHPDAPVRCRGWKGGKPIGGGVTDPYIPLVAYTEEQSEELAYYTLYVVLSEGPLASDFDIGLARIMRKGGDGKAVALATAPDARDGARTSFQVFDETHRFVLPRLKEAHRTMMANLPKRKIADSWSLEVTTAPAPGEGSVGEATHDYARAVSDGKLSDSRLFYFHRQASDGHDLTTEAGVRAAVLEASGPVAEWSDIESIIEQWRDPTADRPYLERVWLNRLVKATERAFDAERWKELADPEVTIEAGEMITLGFDGSRSEDATGLVATHIKTGHQWLVGCWERPPRREVWSVPEDEVDAAMSYAFTQWDVWRLYADPYYWESWLAVWAGRWGGDKVLRWPTNRLVPMSHAVLNFASAIQSGDLSHDGAPVLAQHIGNAHRRPSSARDAEGRPLWVLAKERPDSPHKIDAAMAAVLSWEARTDAIRAGVGERKRSVYEDRGVLTI